MTSLFSPNYPTSVKMTTDEQREKLDAVERAVELLLYAAREAHTAGVATYVPFDALPKAWRADLAAAARGVVMAESLERRQRAELAARAYVERWMRAEAMSVSTDQFSLWQEQLAREVLSTFIHNITRAGGPSIVSEVLGAYQGALCQ